MTLAPALSELLLRQSPGCAWLLERDGKFHAVYGDAARVFGDEATEPAARNFMDLCEPPARAVWTGRLQRVFAGETIAAAGRLGRGRTFSITLFPVRPSSGEIAFAGGVAHEMPEAGFVLDTLESSETTRVRLSRLLHDHIGQGLSAAGLQLDLLRMDLAEGSLPVSARLGELQATLESIIEKLRTVNRELNPAVAERVGLRAALDCLAGRLRADFKGNLRVFADATAQPPPEAAAALYRIAEEAAGLAARRTGCSTIEILLKSLRSGTALEIRDNGPGVEPADRVWQDGGLEFLVMRHFAERGAIELTIGSAPDQGTVIRALCRSAEPGPKDAP
jgi:hypothetical protein